ncbi:MAG TPA: tryptophan synthase subunit alpha [Methylomusa anaerophila]|uniref:Tryptophan synthase alpha chain n=1 Tax=Methylomusa anaerophila TaxID=1930071 RepID=A0A348ANR5_9FIRM|nr:tryptophan synthase subunit alpha [Methylomusa anaerophila]BBB92713.1 tryptophan synthase alpha chain [Methylomusa anaerophila]HML87434.1 tryptophan synthase subunit alpha [Methylomusa anaerophila]
MSRLNDKFDQLKNSGRKGLIVYLTAGCPNFDDTLQAVLKLEQAGADIVEIGIPFSDPMADGPVIQKAAVMALKGGATTGKVQELVERIRQKSAIPLAVMTYVNSIIQFGTEKFIHSFATAGIDGVIVPDLPVEEAAIVAPVCRNFDMDFIQFVAPTTTSERIQALTSQATGFIYCITSTGVTGVREIDYRPIAAVIEKVRNRTQVPLAVGFGIGSPESARQAARYADGVIVGSAVMERMMTGGIDTARDLVRSIRQALDEGETGG